MLQLAFVLVGADAFRSRWHVVVALGAAFVALALVLMSGISGELTLFAQGFVALVLVANGLLAFLLYLTRDPGANRRLTLLKGIGLVLLGVLVLLSTHWAQVAVAMLFSAAFAVDGLIRIAMANVTHYSGWRLSFLGGVGELLVAVLVATDWPFPPGHSVPFCVGLMLGVMGWLLVKFGLMFRTLEPEAAILNLPMFTGRGWYDHAPVLVGEAPRHDPDKVLTVHVWTPVGSAQAPERRLLVDRYLAAVDADGTLSTGHSSLELFPDLYISHYPASEIEQSPGQLRRSLLATRQNDQAGRFLASYAEEVASWCPADAHVEFRRFDTRRLRAFWAGYRQESTYNLTNRNCSIVVAAALDATLEGSLASRRPWLRLLGLLLNPDLWTASLVRGRAVSMTWTPGLVLDYARVLARIVHTPDLSWPERFRGFVSRLRPAARGAEVPAP